MQKRGDVDVGGVVDAKSKGKHKMTWNEGVECVRNDKRAAELKKWLDTSHFVSDLLIKWCLLSDISHFLSDLLSDAC